MVGLWIWETGLTNAYAVQLLRRKVQLKPDNVPKLHASVPDFIDSQIRLMVEPLLDPMIHPSSRILASTGYIIPPQFIFFLKSNY